MAERVKVSVDNRLFFSEISSLVSEGNSVLFKVRGKSMMPFLHGDRDSVILSPFSEDDISVGKIVLAMDIDGRIILHRVIAVGDRAVTLMGDGICNRTETADFSRIAGVVTEVVRNGKRINAGSLSWRMLSSFWRILTPIRRYLLAVYFRFA